jgi:hypothetical protein
MKLIMPSNHSPGREEPNVEQPNTGNQIAVTPPPTPQGNQAAKKLAGMMQDLEPILEVLGIDKQMRGKIIFNLVVKGKLGGLGGLFSGKDTRTRMEKFWDGMVQGLPFIVGIYGMILLTLLLKKWSVI